jgi:AcrR family transcriptional regulator
MGSFFHHFDSKEALAVIEYWIEGSDALIASALYNESGDALTQLHVYLDFCKAQLTGELPNFTRLAGIVAREVCDTHWRSKRHATGASAGTSQRWLPTLKRRGSSAHSPNLDGQKTSFCASKRASRARSS